MKQYKILHLGCGRQKKKQAIGVDINPKSAADVIHDLNIFPYPFRKNQFKVIIAEHIIEHLDNIPKVFAELHRISINGAQIFILSPHFSSIDSFTDPSHKHFITSRTFDYFIHETDLYPMYALNCRYKKISVRLGPQRIENMFLKFLLSIVNRYPLLYEKRFAFIFPVGTIQFELEVVK